MIIKWEMRLLFVKFLRETHLLLCGYNQNYRNTLIISDK
jgi:hypothetical protein